MQVIVAEAVKELLESALSDLTIKAVLNQLKEIKHEEIVNLSPEQQYECYLVLKVTLELYLMDRQKTISKVKKAASVFQVKDAPFRVRDHKSDLLNLKFATPQ